VRELDPDGKTVVVAHEAVSSYMAAMTMPFRASSPGELSGLRPGDQISFRLLVSATDSWIEQIRKTGRHFESAARTEVRPETQATNTARHPLFSYKFTNELGQAVSLDEFDGQALAITFFFTRCPIPNFCPRLSRNFEEAAKKLSQTPNAPTNWHMLSFTFDSEYDTPLVLKAYAEQYHYDSRHWSFLTGPAEKIGELAKLSGVTFSKEGGFYNHNFRTLIINAAGELQMAFPVSGDLSDSIAEQLRTAAAVTNKQRDPHPQSGS
jgi:protein SCO1/2